MLKKNSRFGKVKCFLLRFWNMQATEGKKKEEKKNYLITLNSVTYIFLLWLFLTIVYVCVLFLDVVESMYE